MPLSGRADALRGRRRRVPSILLVAVVAVAGWSVQFDLPIPGLDPSSNAGLFMAAHRGLDFGTEIVYTYGPLGYLGQGNATLWYDGLAVATFVYSSAIYLAFCFALVWGLRRSIGAIGAVLVTFVAIALLPSVEEALVVAVAACLAACVSARPRFALDALLVGGASFAALQVVVKLSIGPAILAIFALGLIGSRAGVRRLALFAALFAAEVPLLWMLSGQDLGALPDYVRNSAEIISGYSEAMAFGSSPDWQLLAGVLALVLLVSLAGLADYRDQRARWSTVAIVAIAGFAVFKEGVVRFDPVHLTILFSTAAALFLLLPFAGRRRLLLVGGGAALVMLAQVVAPAGFSPHLNPIENARFAGNQVEMLLSPSRREEDVDAAKEALRATYRLDERTLGQLRGRSVAIDPWEVGIAWAYDLDWSPLPVFQSYAAYTEELDALNADEVAAADGPARILRVNPAEVVGDALTRAIDDRYPAWDPPAQALATLCHFAPLSTDSRYEVLGRTNDRCDAPQPAGSLDVTAGEATAVPPAGPNEIVFARIGGAGVSGLESLRTLIYRARFRFVSLEGGRSFRLVPGTAADGVLLRGDPRLVGRGAFAQAPQSPSIAVTGAGDDLHVEFFRMSVSQPHQHSTG